MNFVVTPEGELVDVIPEMGLGAQLAVAGFVFLGALAFMSAIARADRAELELMTARDEARAARDLAAREVSS